MLHTIQDIFSKCQLNDYVWAVSEGIEDISKWLDIQPLYLHMLLG